jgi:pyruvate/2-oxoglutarate dehydrogenase complex dihydrolipoamide acyltransferase (E2) component
MNEDSPDAPQSPTVDTPQKEMNEDSPDVPQTPTENDTRRKENDDRIAQIYNWHKEETKRARAKRMDENSPQWAVELGNWYKEEEEQLKRTRDPTHKEQIKEKMLFIKNTISIRTEYEDADWKKEYRRLKKN